MGRYGIRGKNPDRNYRGKSPTEFGEKVKQVLEKWHAEGCPCSLKQLAMELNCSPSTLVKYNQKRQNTTNLPQEELAMQELEKILYQIARRKRNGKRRI